MLTTAVKVKPVVRFREFPFGAVGDPSMREFRADEPWKDQEKVLDYLHSGYVVALVMGADLPDRFDASCRANPVINGKVEGGATPMTDGVWLWPAGLIYFIEKYNVRVPQEFIDYAARNGWRVDQEAVRRGSYEFDY
jgi:hypothetical protein